MHGKTVLITGGNSGIGRATAQGLAERGARLVLACRGLERAESVGREISRETDNPEVHVRQLDLAAFRSVRRFARDFLAEFARLDVLINNAAVFPRRLEKTEDGFEAQFGINHLGHFLLTELLLERLRASAPARVIHLTSMLHARGRIDFGSFRGEARYDPLTAYTQSKLCNVLFSNELARRLRGSRVTSNAVHPGGIRTRIMRDAPFWMRIATRLAFKSPAKGAETPIFLASDLRLEQTSGKYFVDCTVREPAAMARDPELGERLWNASAALIELS